MKLLYKQHLLNEACHISGDDFFSNYWRTAAIEYSKALGFKPMDYYTAITNIMYSDESLYAGVTDDIAPIENINYYLYDKPSNELYWFKTAADACYFAADFVGSAVVYTRPQEAFNYDGAFGENRRKTIDGLIWLTADDFDYLEVARSTTYYHCVENNLDFISMDDAADWLVSSGKAAAKASALRSLKKFFDGESKRCYGLTWKII